MTVGILLFPGVEELDFVGPWEMFGMWHQVADGPRCLTVAEHTAPVRCAKGLSVNPDVGFDDCPPLDYLVVPGGQGTRTEVDNARLVGFIAAHGQTCKAVLSVCTGAFLLQAAGLLAGKQATTHWSTLKRLRSMPGVTVVEQRYVQTDRVWTAAGVSAGIDAALAMIASVAGEEAASKVQFAAEYYPSATRYGALHTTHPSAPAYVRDA